MPDTTPDDLKSAQHRLNKLRQSRVRPDRDLSLHFMEKQFKRDIEKPYKQLGKLTELWQQLIPETLLPHTRLESLSRGVLTITVQGSAHLYELDNLLRSGLQAELITQCKQLSLRRIKLQIGVIK